MGGYVDGNKKKSHKNIRVARRKSLLAIHIVHTSRVCRVRAARLSLVKKVADCGEYRMNQ